MIIAAAIKVGDNIHIGKRHFKIMNDPNIPKSYFKYGEQGFITDKGIFLNRIDAGKHAIECGQIVNLRYNPIELFSEEIINDEN